MGINGAKALFMSKISWKLEVNLSTIKFNKTDSNLIFQYPVALIPWKVNSPESLAIEFEVISFFQFKQGNQ